MWRKIAKKESARIKLMDALVKIGKEKRFEDISITELCQEANIHRCTFYNHYETKDDLLRDMESIYLEASDHFGKKLPALNLDDPEESYRQWCTICENLAEFHIQTRDMFLFLMSPDGDPYFRLRLKKMMKSYYIHMLEGNHPQSKVNVDYISDFLASGIIDMICFWLEQEELTVADFVALLSKMVLIIVHVFKETPSAGGVR